MLAAGPLRSNSREPIPIDARAADHLKYIRETMESRFSERRDRIIDHDAGASMERKKQEGYF